MKRYSEHGVAWAVASESGAAADPAAGPSKFQVEATATLAALLEACPCEEAVKITAARVVVSAAAPAVPAAPPPLLSPPSMLLSSASVKPVAAAAAAFATPRGPPPAPAPAAAAGGVGAITVAGAAVAVIDRINEGLANLSNSPSRPIGSGIGSGAAAAAAASAAITSTSGGDDSGEGACQAGWDEVLDAMDDVLGSIMAAETTMDSGARTAEEEAAAAAAAASSLALVESVLQQVGRW